MRRAAGADVGVFYLDDAHVFRKLKLAAVLERFQHILRRERRRDLVVCRDGAVCHALDLKKLLPRKLAVEIYRHNVAAHVEADIVVPIFLMHKPRHNMLAGVILHPAKARFPVDGAVVGLARLQRLVYIMFDFPVFLVRVKNANAADHSAVAELAAALGEKRRAVERDLKSVIVLFARGNRCREGFHVAVDII